MFDDSENLKKDTLHLKHDNTYANKDLYGEITPKNHFMNEDAAHNHREKDSVREMHHNSLGMHFKQVCAPNSEIYTRYELPAVFLHPNGSSLLECNYLQEEMNEWAPIAKNYDPLKAGSIDGTDEEPHDRAVLRAMLARYVPNKGVVGDPQLTLFVARLSQLTTEEKLKEVFSRYGDIQRIRLVRDFITGFSKGYAFIEYKQEHAIKKAYRDANKLVIDQREVFVDFEVERTLKGWIPRRLGGGFGGKKESGQLRFGGRDRLFRKPINLPFFQSNPRLEAHGENRQRSRSRERPYDRRGKKEYTRDRGRDSRWPQRSEREHTTERHSREERNRGDKDRSRRESKRERSRERDHRR